MKFGVVVFPGSNCDRDSYYVIESILKCSVDYIWHTTYKLTRYDCIILPGGFSYGDYLRCGAMAIHSPVIYGLKEHIIRGRPVIGICNGFQILTEMGALPGALLINKSAKFNCEPVELLVTRSKTMFTNKYTKGQQLVMPVAHKEGRYIIDDVGLQDLIHNKQIILRYVRNPNGSVFDIAGVTNKQGNVLGMMPHPERASESILGSVDGLNIFKSVLDND